MNIEFTYETEEERKYVERVHTERLVRKFFDEIEEVDRLEKHKKDGDIFGRKIAFTINKEVIPPYVDDYGNRFKGWSERLILEPIKVNEVKLEIPKPLYKPNYTFKERIKILFKGEI